MKFMLSVFLPVNTLFFQSVLPTTCVARTDSLMLFGINLDYFLPYFSHLS